MLLSSWTAPQRTARCSCALVSWLTTSPGISSALDLFEVVAVVLPVFLDSIFPQVVLLVSLDSIFSQAFCERRRSSICQQRRHPPRSFLHRAGQVRVVAVVFCLKYFEKYMIIVQQGRSVCLAPVLIVFTTVILPLISDFCMHWAGEWACLSFVLNQDS